MPLFVNVKGPRRLQWLISKCVRFHPNTNDINTVTMPVNHIYQFNLKFVIRDVSGHVENMNTAPTKYRFMYIHFVFYPFSYFYTLEDAALSVEHFRIVVFFILENDLSFVFQQSQKYLYSCQLLKWVCSAFSCQ